MRQVVIENPILNSPFEEPRRHFLFSAAGITEEVVEARRSSGYFVPVPQPKKKGTQLLIPEWTQDRFQDCEFINRVRDRVKAWREQSPRWQGVTATTRRLLEHWSAPERERRLFFCQLEALETAIYLAEVASKREDAWIFNSLVDANSAHNPALFRVAFRMATGSGKTVVMAMLIAWQSLNKLASPQDARFSDAFLVVAPGITIRDRLRVLLPSDPESYYRQHDLVPRELAERLGQAKIVVTNFHAFLLREREKVSKLGKQILRRGDGAFREGPGAMVRRVCRELGSKRNLVVLNDEAHHCYRPKPSEPAADDAPLSGEEKREVKERNEEARVWISGLEAVAAKLGVRAVYDLSATPFFLKGSGYGEGTLFPWVVSDFSLIDAIESGIVKIPRVPVDDDAMTGDTPTYRDLWTRIRDQLPKGSRRAEADTEPPKLPAPLQGALESLYGHYRKEHERWAANAEAARRGLTPPVFIVVAQNTRISKMLYDFIAGYEKRDAEGKPLLGSDGEPVLVPGALPLFSNVEDGRWKPRPPSILVDSRELESGGTMSDDFKRVVAQEIDEWKASYRERFPGRDTDDLTDEDLLREVLNTVGKADRLGEGVKCVVSVSMLTEGWDATTVTHILGVRAFGTELLCEQVVGRGLRRMSYALGPDGRFAPEYAEVYGVRFSFLPTSGSRGEVKEGPVSTRVRALPERAELSLSFPRVVGYRVELGRQRLVADFGRESRFEVSTQDVPSWTETAAVLGEGAVHTLDDLKARRSQEVVFLLAKLVAETYFESQPWRFPELLALTRRWLDECLVLKDNVFVQYLLLTELAQKAAEKISNAIASGTAADAGSESLRPLLAPYEHTGSTHGVSFATTKPTYTTRDDKCHLSHVVLDAPDWEAKLAQSLEEMSEVRRPISSPRLASEAGDSA